LVSAARRRSNPSVTLSIYSHWFKNGAAGGTIALLAKAVIGEDFTRVSDRPEKWAESGHSDEPDPRVNLATG
jgi:hypothetical protein